MKIKLTAIFSIILACMLTIGVSATNYDFSSECPGAFHPNGTYSLEDPYCSGWSAPDREGTCVFAGHYQLCDVVIYENYTGYHCSYHYNNTMVPGTTVHIERITHTDGHGTVVIDDASCQYK